MATTAPEQIPMTIISRVQRFRFKPIPTEEIAEQLESIVKKEKFKIDPDAVLLVAQIANGSMRDSLSMLDQVMSMSPDKKVVSEVVRELLGISSVNMVSSFLDLIAKTGTGNRNKSYFLHQRCLNKNFPIFYFNICKLGTLCSIKKTFPDTA